MHFLNCLVKLTSQEAKENSDMFYPLLERKEGFKGGRQGAQASKASF